MNDARLSGFRLRAAVELDDAAILASLEPPPSRELRDRLLWATALSRGRSAGQQMDVSPVAARRARALLGGDARRDRVDDAVLRGLRAPRARHAGRA